MTPLGIQDILGVYVGAAPVSAVHVGPVTYNQAPVVTGDPLTRLFDVSDVELHSFSGDPTQAMNLASYSPATAEIGTSATSIGDYAFYSCPSLTSATIPNSVTSIGSYAFSVCSGLTALTIPNSVTSIGAGAFQSCSGLTDLTIPNSVTNIESYAFQNCSGLTGALTIPNSVTSIGGSAFSGCSGLTAIYAEGNAPSSVGSYAFFYVSAPIYYKAGTTGWTNPWNGIATAEWTSWPDPMP